MTLTMTTDEARRDWRNVIEKAYIDRDEIVMKRYNTPAAVVVNYEVWQMLTSQRQERIKKLIQEVKDGDFMTQEEVEQGLKERGLL